MRDYGFNEHSLEKEFRASDFGPASQINSNNTKEQILARAVSEARNGLPNFNFLVNNLRGKNVYKVAKLEHDLILRHLDNSISRLTGVKQSDRHTIIDQLKVILSDGADYRIYKIDLRNFYESVMLTEIGTRLALDLGFPRDALAVFNAFRDGVEKHSILGLPRGLAISATLSEYILRDFDKAIARNKNVHFFCRYVDDIIVVTSAEEIASRQLRTILRSLPKGLFANRKKTSWLDIKKNTQPVTGSSFDFLGYRFVILPVKRNAPHNMENREVRIDIAEKKVVRMKTRLILSIRRYTRDKNFADLCSRIRIITGNYNIYDRNKQLTRNVGLYFNYRLIDSAHSESLKSLDKFWQQIVISKHGPLGAKISIIMSKKERKRLLRFQFEKSFNQRPFYNFNATELTRLIGCWMYA